MNTSSIEKNDTKGLPPLIDTALTILGTKYSSADTETSKSLRYREIMFERASEIWSWYPNNSQLYFDGFMHEGCFLWAFKNCLQTEFNISHTEEKDDIGGIDFKLELEDKAHKIHKVDVTVSPRSYAEKLGLRCYKSSPILLPVYVNESRNTYVNKFLKSPTQEASQEYINHIVEYNRDILHNKVGEKFKINIVKKKGNEQAKAVHFANNSSYLHSIYIHKARYKRILKLLDLLEDSIL